EYLRIGESTGTIDERQQDDLAGGIAPMDVEHDGGTRLGRDRACLRPEQRTVDTAVLAAMAGERAQPEALDDFDEIAIVDGVHQFGTRASRGRVARIGHVSRE